MFCDVKVCHRLMAVVVKAMHTTSQQILLESLLSDVQYALTVGIMTDTQAIDIVTFDFKGTQFRCFVSGSYDYQVKFS